MIPPDATSPQRPYKCLLLDISRAVIPDFLFFPEVLRHSVYLGAWNNGKYSQLHMVIGLVILLSVAILACVFAALAVCDTCCTDGALTITLVNHVSGCSNQIKARGSLP